MKLKPCPFCGELPIKFGNETTCECTNPYCGIVGVPVEVDLWEKRQEAAQPQED